MTAANRIKRSLALSMLMCATGLLLIASPASGAAKWDLTSATQTNAAPGEEFAYAIHIRNAGDSPTPSSDPVLFTIDLPAGLTLASEPEAVAESFDCEGSPGASTATCTALVVPPTHEEVQGTAVVAPVLVDPGASGVLSARFGLSGGGLAPVGIVDPTTITAEPPSFGVDAFEATLAKASGALFTQAGGHPSSFDVQFDFNNVSDAEFGDLWPVAPFRGFVLDMPAGFAMNPTTAERCTAGELAEVKEGVGLLPHPTPLCPVGSQIGSNVARFAFGAGINNRSIWAGPISLFNMPPPPGVFARYGFNNFGVLGAFDVYVRNESDHGFSIKLSDVSRNLGQYALRFSLWGDPGDASHDLERSCPGQELPWIGGPLCPASRVGMTFLRAPTSCTPAGEGLTTTGWLSSWDPGVGSVPFSSTTHELPGYPASPKDPTTPWGEEVGTTGCADVPVKGNLSLQPTSDVAGSGAGLDVKVTVPNGGLSNPGGIASSDIKAMKVTLPAGVTVNPSRAEGLSACTPAQYAAESLESPFGGGCPAASKIGTVSVDTPLLDEDLEGSVFVAQPDDPATLAPKAENPFDSLLALYLVMENAERGVIVKLAGRVETDATGRIATTIGGIPQQPFDSFRMHLDAGLRSPLVTPRSCGKHSTETEFIPWSNPSSTLHSVSSFEIAHGPGGGPCASGKVAEPRFQAGTLRAKAGSSSPFLTTLSGEEIASLSLDLPAGLATKLGGLVQCSDADLAATERDSATLAASDPICPAASRVGEAVAGFGIGGVLARSPGHIFLAGPYRGAPLSLASVIPVKIGPFDLGTVVQRSALFIDPRTAAVRLDAAGSTPIPSALRGIALHLSELRLRLNRPGFTLNPTSCSKKVVDATAKGAGANLSNPNDDPSWNLSNPFSATGCAALDLEPRLSLALRGDTGRGGHPSLVSTLRPRLGDSNIRTTELRLPGATSLDAGSTDSVCSKRSFKKDRCPKATRRGSATVATPLLAKPLRGPVYLRASSGPLPDLAIALDGEVEIDLTGRIGTRKGATAIKFGPLPDVPVGKLVLRLDGGAEGLLVAGGGACRGIRGEVRFKGHNGKAITSKPELKCD